MRPFYEDKWATILHGSCLDTDLKGITGIVTDPPYELSFMGEKWDGTGISFQTETWRILRECCKPGAMLLSFGGTRTFHRIAVAIEDAGWEFRDTIMWLYGSGFPKSLDISKAIDKQAGAAREVVGNYHIPSDSTSGHAGKPYSDKPINGNIYCLMIKESKYVANFMADNGNLIGKEL